MQPELVTVCINTFNRKKLLPAALNSVLSQTYNNIEVIIVDDHSTDGTKELIENQLLAIDRRIKYFRHEKNKGLAAARNTALFAAKGKYFSFCDDDDRWPPTLLKKLVESIEKSNLEIGMALSLAEIINDNYRRFLKSCPNLTEIMKSGITPPVSSQLYKTQILHNTGGYNPKIKSGVDHDLWITLSSVNPRASILMGLHAVSYKDPDLHRMTTDECLRKNNIAESLKLWKPMIIRVFGSDFYDYFYSSYMRHINYKFFEISVRDKNYLLSMQKLFQKYVIREILRRFYAKITSTQLCNLFPAYKPLNDLKD